MTQRVPILPILLAAVAPVAPARAQVSGSTIFQSIIPYASSVGVPGNPSITYNEIVSWSQGSQGRAYLNGQALSVILGDVTGDGLPLDFPDIDALALQGAFSTPPTPFDFLFSVTSAIVSYTWTRAPIVTPGDIFRLSAIGSHQIVCSRSQLQAALGTTASLDVDAVAWAADGSLLVSFQNTAAGSNIVHPTFGTTGIQVTFDPQDVFVIRQPFGVLPAILLWRAADLAPINAAVFGSATMSNVNALEVQPGAGAPQNNPWDPTNIWNGGNRPHILFTRDADENVLCTNPGANPVAPGSYIWALVEGGSGLGYSTGQSNPQVTADALALTTPAVQGMHALTIDVQSATPNPGASETFYVRGLPSAGLFVQLVAGISLSGGIGVPFGSAGFQYVVIPLADPVLQATISPGLAAAFLTGPSTSAGVATSGAITVPPTLTGYKIYVQGVVYTGGFPLTAPTVIRVN